MNKNIYKIKASTNKENTLNIINKYEKEEFNNKEIYEETLSILINNLLAKITKIENSEEKIIEININSTSINIIESENNKDDKDLQIKPEELNELKKAMLCISVYLRDLELTDINIKLNNKGGNK